MLKRIQEILESNPDLTKYQFDYDPCMDSYHGSFIMDLHLSNLARSKDLRKDLTKRIVDRVSADKLLITGLAVTTAHGGDSYLIAIRTLDFTKALRDESCSLTGEVLFKLKMKEMELI